MDQRNCQHMEPFFRITIFHWIGPLRYRISEPEFVIFRQMFLDIYSFKFSSKDVFSIGIFKFWISTKLNILDLDRHGYVDVVSPGVLQERKTLQRFFDVRQTGSYDCKFWTVVNIHSLYFVVSSSNSALPSLKFWNYSTYLKFSVSLLVLPFFDVCGLCNYHKMPVIRFKIERQG